MDLDPDLLAVLVCPECRSTLFVDVDADELVCQECRLAYPVRHNIPVMLTHEARAV